MRKLFSLALAFVLLAAAASFSVNTARAQEKLPTIAEIAGGKDFTTLLAAVKAAGLDTTLADATAGPFTVFAPTNAAFEALLKDLNLTAEKLLEDRVLLTSVLIYHVVPGNIDSTLVAQADGAKVATALWNETLTIAVKDGKVMINESNVTAVDVKASNGIVHVIDKVLVPKEGAANLKLITDTSAELGKVEKDIIGVATGADGVKTLVAAVGAAPDVVKYLQGKNNAFTVFAPTDKAFETGFTTLKVKPEDFLKDTKTVAEVLSGHVVPWPYPSSVLANYNDVLLGTALPNFVLRVTVADGKVQVGGINVVTADVNAKNGVIHVIDDVITTPSLRAMLAPATPAATATK
jgi:transforming growth factor-beta-induced protein